MSAFYDQALSQALYDHAVDHYGESGWDIVVETMDLTEIDDVLEQARARTLPAALTAFSRIVSVWADRRADIQSTIF